MAEKSKEKSKTIDVTSGSLKCSCSLVGTRYCTFCQYNPSKRALTIRASLSSEFTTDVVVEGVKYHVQTEKLSPRKPFIITSVFKAGAIISTKRTDYGPLLGDADLNTKLTDLMRREHLTAIDKLREEKPRSRKDPSEYVDQLQKLLKLHRYDAALRLLRSAMAEHPFNPVLLSYYGCLDAVWDKNYERGIKNCKDAIEILRKEVPIGREAFYPLFYLNLGRAYLAAGDRNNAVESFTKGLKADPDDDYLLMELRSLGSRKKKVIPFLKRSNPINKYIGILLRK